MNWHKPLFAEEKLIQILGGTYKGFWWPNQIASLWNSVSDIHTLKFKLLAISKDLEAIKQYLGIEMVDIPAERVTRKVKEEHENLMSGYG